MESETAQRAVRAAMSVAGAAGLTAGDAVVLNDSNRLVVRLLPCDTVARVAPVGWFSAAREVELAHRLAEEANCPVAGLDPRVEPHVVVHDGFEISLWTHYEPWESHELPPVDYALALERLHGGLCRIDMGAPHFTDRLAEIRRWLADEDATPDLTDQDRELLADRLDARRLSTTGRGAAEQLLHGEPHPWNVLAGDDGLRFIDFENCARGPVEYDLAWVPRSVSQGRHDADQDLVSECRAVVLALVAAHRWHRDDQHPSGRQSGVAFLEALRSGPPWPALDDIHW